MVNRKMVIIKWLFAPFGSVIYGYLVAMRSLLTRKIQRIFRHLWLTKSQIQVCQLFHSTVIFKTDENFIPKLEGIEFDFYQG